MNETINNLLDFDTPNVGYEDSKGKNVCGCCGTYFVVGNGEVEEIKEIVSDMYEFCHELLFSIDTGYERLGAGREGSLRRVLSKTEGK